MIFSRLDKAFSITLSALCLIIFLCNYCSTLQDGLRVDPSTIKINVDTTNTVFDRYKITFGTTKILIQNVPQDDGFFLIQVHSFAQKVSLTNDTNFNLHSSVSGTNVGLVKILLPTDATKTFPFYLRANQSGTVLIAVTVYSSSDPIPGGCSMTFNTDIAPYLNLTYTEALIDVNYQDASLFRHLCEENVVRLEMYRMYVTQNDFSSDTYFNNIQNMLTVDDIRKNGENITGRGVRTSGLRKYLRGYMGYGQIIAVVGVSGNRSAAYVPAVTYSCNVTYGSKSCYDYNITLWGVLTAIMLIYGIAMFFAEDWLGITVCFLNLGVATYVFYNVLNYTIDISDYVMIMCVVGFIIAYSIFFVCILRLLSKGSVDTTSCFPNCVTSLLCGLYIATLIVTAAPMETFSPTVFRSIFVGITALIFILILGISFMNPFAYNLMAIALIMMSWSYFVNGTIHHIVNDFIRYNTVHHYDVAVKIDLFNNLIILGIAIALLRSICGVSEGRRGFSLRIARFRVDRFNYTQF